MAAVASRSSDDACDARQTTIIAAVLLCVGESCFVLLNRGLAGELRAMYVIHAVVSAVVALVLWRHRTIAARRSLAAFLVLVVPLLPMFWIAETYAVEGGPLWQPLIGRKLIILGLALLTPCSLRVAAILVALFMAETVVLWGHLDLAHNPIVTAAGEPWMTIIYFGAAASLVALRGRSRRLKNELLEARAEAQSIGHLKQVSLAVGDQVNTPLQALEAGIVLLEIRHPEEATMLARMSRSLHKLIELSRGLRGWSDAEHRVEEMRAARDRGAELDRTAGGATTNSRARH
ncbi:MAG: hypothetical protein JWP87_3696 [Labilithrix sp.]|nr:hypothetical protein [Labilithrix sp.]